MTAATEVAEITDPAALNVTNQVDPNRKLNLLWEDTPHGALARKITFILQMYPHISPTMMQISMSPSIKVGTWKPILAQLIEAGIVYEYSIARQAPNGQYRSYKVLCLIDNLDSKPVFNDAEQTPE